MSMPARGVESTACFSVHAAFDTSVMPKVLAVFSRRGMVPTTWHSSVCGNEGDEIQIDLQMAGLDPRQTEVLAESLRQIVNVECVLTSEKRRAMTA